MSQDEVELVRQFNGDAKKFSSLTQGPLLVILNIEKVCALLLDHSSLCT